MRLLRVLQLEVHGKAIVGCPVLAMATVSSTNLMFSALDMICKAIAVYGALTA